MAKNLIAGLVYPVLILHFAIIALPVVTFITEGLGAYISQVLKLLIPLYLFIPIVYICKRILRIFWVKKLYDSFVLKVPFFGGLFKSIVYGTLVALAGCQQGMACGNSALAVGQSTTRAVVMGIVLIVVSASILTVIYINLGI